MKEPSHKNKIFGIGLTRTGTTSLTEALSLLGYRTVHFPNDQVTQSEFFHFFASPAEFIHLSILNGHDAITDTPVCCLYKPLDKSYPGSKFILTIREKQAWLDSCTRYYKEVLEYWMTDFDHPDNKYVRFINDTLYGPQNYDPAKLYDAYHAEVFEYFRDRPQDLLVLDICSGEGWNKLAPFLGHPIPSISFPWENQL